MFSYEYICIFRASIFGVKMKCVPLLGFEMTNKCVDKIEYVRIVFTVLGEYADVFKCCFQTKGIECALHRHIYIELVRTSP